MASGGHRSVTVGTCEAACGCRTRLACAHESAGDGHLAGGRVAGARRAAPLATTSRPRSPPRPRPPPRRPRPRPARRPIRPTLDPDDPALDAALSRPVEDRVYPGGRRPRGGRPALPARPDLDPEVGDPRRGGDADLPGHRGCGGVPARLRQEPSPSPRLALDGEKATFRERGKDLVVGAPVRADDRYTLEVRYRGTPKPVAAPTTRDDFSTIGWTVTDKGETWTMQEPFGAYSWYAVNDHPSDKALYDFTLTTPLPVGRRGQRQAGVAQGGRREHRHRLAPRRARGVVPRDRGVRGLQDDQGPVEERGAR